MRELLINRSNNPLEIPQNKFGKNDYIKNILDCTDRKISIEVSPNNDFQTDSLEKIGPRFIAVTWLGNTHLQLPTHEIPALILARKLCDGDFLVLLHLAGRNIRKERMMEILTYFRESGVKNILALQGGCTDRKISIEVSPNNDFQTDSLEKIGPRFIAVTWLGNTHLQLPTHEIPALILARKLCDGDFPVLLHLAGRNIGKERMMEILTYLRESGVKNILALQGDWIHVLEEDDCKCDFPYASSLVSFIKSNFGDAFCVGVAAYPNLHPQCQGEEENMKYLKQKVSSGADFIITQATFDYKILEKFAVTCRKYDINVPILPGVFIIKSYKSLMNMMKFCQLKVAENVLDFVEKNRENDAVVESYGLDLASDLIRMCLGHKELFSGVHIFTMNDLAEVEKVLSHL